MARLNEPPPPVETIDSLRRRFIRQNREIIRANSAQSLRIRELESEVSALISENITFREEIVRLQVEATRAKNRTDNVDFIKQQLEEKMQEIGAMVAKLGISKRPERRSSGFSATDATPKAVRPDRQWRSFMRLSGGASGDGSLPPIVEGKYYPRKTLDTEEIEAAMEQELDCDSPNLGPPPVAHLVDEEDFADQVGEGEGPAELKLQNMDETGILPPNLETRRKRRDSKALLYGEGFVDHRIGESAASLFPPKGASGSQPVKMGAKRKLSARDSEERTHTASQTKQAAYDSNENESPVHTDDYEAALLENIPEKKEASQAASTVRVLNSERGDARSSNPAFAGRKVLGQKNVNTDPVVSPVKKRGQDKGFEQEKPLKTENSGKKTRRTVRVEESRPHVAKIELQKESDMALEPVEDNEEQQEMHLKTPATDFFSPLSSAASSTRVENKYTPPPSDLVHSSHSVESATAGRPGRRQRTAVSYAEPSLRAKMRRPTKDLVDAVGAEKRRRQEAEARRLRSYDGVHDDNVQANEGKQEVEFLRRDDRAETTRNKISEAEAHNTENGTDPTSPLSTKTPVITEELPPTVVTERRRRSSAMHRYSGPDNSTDSGPIPTSSTTGATIAALMNGSKKPRTSERRKTDILSETPSNTNDIYAFNESLPAEIEGKTGLSRRHSSAALASKIGNAENLVDARVERSSSSRRQKIERRSGENEGSETNTRIDSTESRSSRASAESQDTHMTRGEKAASRRRSMML